MTCDHSSVGADPSKVIFYDCCHLYKRGDRVLTSITSLVKSTWPIKPDFSEADPEVLENARERGIEVDRLFCTWLDGKLSAIPAGTREDSAELLKKLVKWWPHSQLEKTCVSTQVLMADEEIAGTADIIGEGIAELKTVSALEPTYRIQVGGYCHLYEVEHKCLPKWCGVIHITKRFSEPKWVPFEPSVVVSEFRVVRDMWRLTQRLTKRRLESGGV